MMDRAAWSRDGSTARAGVDLESDAKGTRWTPFRSRNVGALPDIQTAGVSRNARADLARGAETGREQF